jgi:hypothetical protein
MLGAFGYQVFSADEPILTLRACRNGPHGEAGMRFNPAEECLVVGIGEAGPAGELFVKGIVVGTANAHFYSGKSGEDIPLSNDEGGNAVDLDGILEEGEVQPTAST